MAGSPPTRFSNWGSTLFTPGARCHTTNTAAGKSRGRPRASASIAPMPPAEAPTTTMSFLAIQGPLQASGPHVRTALLRFFHQDDGAFALLARRDERRAGDVAPDFLAAPVHRVERDLPVLGLAGQDRPDDAAQLRHRQADVEVEQAPALDLVAAQPP